MLADCIVWTGFINRYGYAVRRGQLVHRVTWAYANGPIPDGLVIDHICRNRACVNPAHLRAVTVAVNVTENSNSESAKNKRKTHCVNGHEYTAETTSVNSRGFRSCKQCRRKILGIAS